MSGLDALTASMLSGISPGMDVIKSEELSIPHSDMTSPTSDGSSLSHAPQLASSMPTPFGSYTLPDVGSSQDLQV
jgi:hypothetical protein